MSPTTVLITVIIIAIIALIASPFIWAYQAIQSATDILSGDIGAADTEPRPLHCWMIINFLIFISLCGLVGLSGIIYFTILFIIEANK